MNETLTVHDDRSVLRMERRFAHDPTTVWRAVTEPAHLSAWFPARVETDLAPGAEVTYDMGEGPEVGGTVTALDAPRLLEITWHGDVLRFELRADGDGCLLVFTHTFDDRYGAPSFASGWETCFAGLDDVLADRPVAASAPSAELLGRYVERFGLDAGTVTDTSNGWEVRFERQMAVPADQLWATLCDGAPEPTPGDAVPEGFTVLHMPTGPVLDVGVGHHLELAWLCDGDARGRIRWELRTGTGHGARLVLTHTGSATDQEQRALALTAWRDRINELARSATAPAST